MKLLFSVINFLLLLLLFGFFFMLVTDPLSHEKAIREMNGYDNMLWIIIVPSIVYALALLRKKRGSYLLTLCSFFMCIASFLFTIDTYTGDLYFRSCFFTFIAMFSLSTIHTIASIRRFQIWRIHRKKE